MFRVTHHMQALLRPTPLGRRFLNDLQQLFLAG